jgi:hypothetical protein
LIRKSAGVRGELVREIGQDSCMVVEEIRFMLRGGDLLLEYSGGHTNINEIVASDRGMANEWRYTLETGRTFFRSRCRGGKP